MYISLLSSSKIPPCLPYVGAYLDMIYSLEIGIKTYNSDGLVNFSKMTKVILASMSDMCTACVKVMWGDKICITFAHRLCVFVTVILVYSFEL